MNFRTRSRQLTWPIRSGLILVLLFLSTSLAARPGLGESQTTRPESQAHPSESQSEKIEADDLPSFDFEVQPLHLSDSNQSVRVGDQLRLKLKTSQLPVSQNGVQKFKFEPSISDEELTQQGWQIDQNSDQLEIIATPLKPGELKLPAMTIKDASGKAIARTLPVPLRIESAISPQDPNPQEPAGVEPPLGLAVPLWFILLGVVALIALLALGSYGIYKWIKNKTPKIAQSPVVIRPADEVALENLTQLEAKGFHLKGEFKPHYFGVSEILKTYLGARYLFDAPEKTTREILIYLREHQVIEDSSIQDLGNFLNKLDQVKFTDWVPPLSEASTIIEEARQFVVKTKKAPGVVPHAP